MPRARKELPGERLEVIVPYADFDKGDQYDFRRGVFAGNGETGLSDEELHEALQKEELLLVDFALTLTLKCFSAPFRLGLAYGLIMPSIRKPRRPRSQNPFLSY